MVAALQILVVSEDVLKYKENIMTNQNLNIKKEERGPDSFSGLSGKMQANTMKKKAYTMDKKAWENKYKGYSYSKFK